MRIQHNIMAMNAYRNYNMNNKALSGNLEKLSSGYKINRAGDDAAGLAISEKMRAQITGLNAAQKNVKDGISLVKTAEGAMQEIQDMLNRMDYLATQSANGTYDNEVDRLNLQKEVTALKDEINRIADSANFNGIKLLDGSLDKDKKAVTETVITGGKTDVPILSEVATDPTAEVGTKTVLRGPTAEPGKTELRIDLHDVTLNGKDGDTFTVSIGDEKIELAVTTAGDESKGILKAGDDYTGEKLATAIKNAFTTAGGTIQKQAFTVETGKEGDNAYVTFKQTNEPTKPDEVVSANLGVSFSHKANPDGSPAEYTLEIKKDAIKAGDKLYVGDKYVTITSGNMETDLAAANNVKVGDYEVSYADGKLTVKDPDGTAGAPDVKYDSYDQGVKLDVKAKTDGADAVKAAYSVKVTSAGDFDEAKKAVYSSKVTAASDPKAAVKAVYNTSAYSLSGVAANDTFSFDGGTTTWTVKASGADATKNEINVADVTQGWVANQVAAAYNAGTNDWEASGNANGTITFTAKVAGAVSGSGGAGNPPASAPVLTGVTIIDSGSRITAGTVNGTATTAGADAEVLTFGTGGTAVKLTVVGDNVGTDATANKISVTDAKDATKLAEILAGKLTATGYAVTNDGDKIVYTANSAGAVGTSGPGASPTDLSGDVSGSTGLALGAPTVTTPGAEADKITFSVGGVSTDFTIVDGDTDLTANKIGKADANDAAKLAGILAQKLTDTNYDITADGQNLVFTAKNAGKVDAGNTGTGAAPTAAPTVPTVTFTGSTGSSLAAAATETTKGTDAVKAATTYDLSGLKQGDIVTVNGKNFVAGTNGAIALTDTADGGTETFEDMVKAASQTTGTPTLTDGILKIEADTAGANGSSPTATIKVQTKTQTTAEMEAPEDEDAITGTWNVQSTVNKDGGSKNTSPLASTAFDMTADMVKDGNKLTIGKTTYVFKVGKDSTVTAGKDANGNPEELIDLKDYKADDGQKLMEAAADALANKTNGNSAFSIGYAGGATADSAKITIHEKMGQSDYTTELESVEEFDKLVYMTAPEAESTKTTGKDGKPLTLQIGDTSDSFNQMKVSIGDMHTKAMGTGEYVDENGETQKVEKTIEDINIGTQEGASEAVQVIKNAINYVSSIRGDLGAIQNRLDHTANNLSVMAENIQDAESTIRDTDVAEEMMSYVKNNILVQSAQAMLAQANQVPQGVLQLLG